MKASWTGPKPSIFASNTLRNQAADKQSSCMRNRFKEEAGYYTVNMAQSHGEILEALLNAQKSHEPSIIKLSEPVSGPLKSNPGERTSDVSAEVFENPTPASLEADLAHYKVC
jgi:hypothetical protein